MYEGQSRYAQLVAFLTGEHDVVPPGLELESDRPEWHVLGRSTLGSGYANALGDGTHFPAIGIFNFQANMLTVLTELSWQYDNAVAAKVGFVFFRGAALPGLMTNFGGFATDQRIGTINQQTRTQIAGGGNLALVGGLFWKQYSATTPANVPIVERSPIILGPNSGMILQCTVVGANALFGRFHFYERGLRPEEVGPF